VDTFETLRGNLQLDSEGGLSLGGQPMILLPRHFFLFIMQNIEAVAGRDAWMKVFSRAGYDGAQLFCRRFEEVHGTTPRGAVEGYLAEMSLRGWGQYRILRLEEDPPRLEVLLLSSALRHAQVAEPRHVVWVCAMEGAMAYLGERLGRPTKLVAREVPPLPDDPAGAVRIHVAPQS
jgi:hypothetical protein